MNEQTNPPRRGAQKAEGDMLNQPTAAGDETRGPGKAPRIPFGAPQPKLSQTERPGFKRRYFNDIPGRIDRAKNAGYAHVMDAQGKPISTTVGVAKEGGGLTAYLMEIPSELYDADQAAKMQAIDEFDESIRRGVASGKAPGQDGRYVPTDAYGKPKISMTR
jgi:hypothetical protein